MAKAAVKKTSKATSEEQKAALDPSTKSSAYEYMEAKWAMILTLLGGTDAMRCAERQYLPQHAEESNENYNERLNRNTLFNMFELTLDSLVGKPFVEPVKLNNDVPKSISDPKTGFAKNIDLQGNDISAFCREWLRDAIAKGFSHVIVDMPTLNTEDRDSRTMADDIAEKRRPYWTLVRPENLIFAHATIVNGVEVIDHVRILETERVMVGYSEVEVERIRILTPGLFQVFELKQDADKKDPVWVMVDSGSTDMTTIPLVTYYASRNGFMTSKPPLEDLAHLNVAHWQSTSDQRNVLTVARFPMLAVSGAQMAQGQQEQMAIGPRQLLATRDPNGKFYYVEHSGKAITAGREDLQDLEDRMAAYGAEFLRRKVGGRTATERSLDSSEAISPLKDMTLRFVVAVNRALDLTANWIDEKGGGGTVEINTDFTEEDINSASLTMLTEARKRGDISRRTFLTELKRQEVIAADTNVDAEMKQIEEEAKTLLIKPTFVTASEQIRTMETVMDQSADDTPTDILNDTPGGGDNKTTNKDGTPGPNPSKTANTTTNKNGNPKTQTPGQAEIQPNKPGHVGVGLQK